MSRTVWIIIVVLVVLVLLYVVYNKMFKDKAHAVTAANYNVPLFGGLSPAQYHGSIASSLPSLNTPIVTNNNTDYAGYKDSLNSILTVLGYKIYDSGNTRIASATGKTLEKVQLKYPGNKLVQLEGNWHVDKDKWDLFDKLGLLNITFDSTKDEQYYLIYKKFIEFFGEYFFNLAAQKITDAAKKASIPTVDCNSNSYKDKLNRLYANLKRIGQTYQLAVINLNNVSNAETNQAFERAANAFKIAETEYNNYNKLCKTN